MEKAPKSSRSDPTRLTINDIAKLAGVSKKSVSRTLNDEPGLSAAKRDHIKRVIKESGYEPNRGARALASSKSFLVGLVYNNPNPGFIMEMLTGVQKVAHPAGYEVIMHESKQQGENLISDILEFVGRSRCDALILTPPLSEDLALVATLNSVKVKVTRIAGDDADTPMVQVRYDDRSASQSVTDLFIGNGHTRIGFIGGAAGSGATRRRLAGYRDALRMQGLSFDETLVEFGDFTFSSGVAAGDLLLERDDRPSAIVCANDQMASGVLHSARKHQLRVPDDVCVTGFDDSPLAEQVWPPLTSVSQPVMEMAIRAAELALGLSEPAPNQLPDEFSHRICIRASSG